MGLRTRYMSSCRRRSASSRTSPADHGCRSRPLRTRTHARATTTTHAAHVRLRPRARHAHECPASLPAPRASGFLRQEHKAPAPHLASAMLSRDVCRPDNSAAAAASLCRCGRPPLPAPCAAPPASPCAAAARSSALPRCVKCALSRSSARVVHQGFQDPRPYL